MLKKLITRYTTLAILKAARNDKSGEFVSWIPKESYAPIKRDRRGLATYWFPSSATKEAMSENSRFLLNRLYNRWDVNINLDGNDRKVYSLFVERKGGRRACSQNFIARNDKAAAKLLDFIVENRMFPYNDIWVTKHEIKDSESRNKLLADKLEEARQSAV